MYTEKSDSYVANIREPRKNYDGLDQVYMDIQIGDEEAKRVQFALYNDTVPKTAENFKKLCAPEEGQMCKTVPDKPLGYKVKTYKNLLQFINHS